MSDSEIRRLQKKVEALEERIKELTKATEIAEETETEETTTVSRLARLLEQRDKQLEDYAQELQQKNKQLQLWISTLELYQHIFESDPTILLGISREMKLLLFNSSAQSHMGADIRDKVGKSLNEVNFTDLDPYIPVLVQEALKTGQAREREVKRGERTIQTRCHPLGAENEPRGCLVRIEIRT
jgi:PAS domain-containing protein